MSANICFITAVLAATAFTLASSCHIQPKSSKCVEVPPPPPDCLDYFEVFCRFPSEICTKIFEQKIPTIVSAYKNYIACSEETPRQAFIKLLNEYYSTCSDSLEADIELIYELLYSSGTPHELGCDDFPSCKIVYTPKKGIDLHDFYESAGSTQKVVDFFTTKGYSELLAKYIQWKKQVWNKSLKFLYRECLYDAYRGQKQKLSSDCEAFHQFDLNWKPANIKGLGPVVPKNSIPGCPDSYEIPTYEIVYTPCGKDLYVFLESCGCSEIVASFFSGKGYVELVKIYLQWKFDVGSQYLKKKYREALYDLYRPKTPDNIKKECQDFHVFDDSWKPTCDNGFPLLRAPGYETIISIYRNYPLDKILTFLNEKNMVDLIQPLTTLNNCDDDDALIGFIEAINRYYGQIPDNISIDYDALLEFIGGAPTDSVTIVDGGYTVPRSLPTSDGCDVPFKIPACPQDYFEIYDKLSLPQCAEFFIKNGHADLLKPYIKHKIDSSPASKEAFLKAITKLYTGCGNLPADYELLLTFTDSWTPTGPSSCDGNIVPKIVPAYPKDYFGIYDILPLSQCTDFFIKSGQSDLIIPYITYKIDGSPSGKEAFLTALNDIYGQVSCITTDYDALLEFINGLNSDVIPYGESVQIKEYYTETTTITTGDIDEICPPPSIPQPCSPPPKTCVY